MKKTKFMINLIQENLIGFSMAILSIIFILKRVFDNTNYCEITKQFVIEQEGKIIVEKISFNSNLKRYVSEGTSLLGKNNKIEFYSPLRAYVSLGDTLVKKRLDSVYVIHKKKSIIMVQFGCNYKVDSIAYVSSVPCESPPARDTNNKNLGKPK